MAALDAWAIRALQYMGNDWQILFPQQRPWPAANALSGPGGKQQVACWNWALSGFAPVCVDPGAMFGLLSATHDDPQTIGTLALGKEWFQTRSNMRKLRWIEGQFALNADADRARAALIDLSIRANGLTPQVGASNYQMKVYSTPNTPYPNWSHWWLNVYDATVEHFTNQRDVRIYTGGYAGGHPLGAVTVDTVNLTGIHDRQKNRIQWILKQRRDDVVLRHPGGRQPWIADNNRAACQICFQDFAFYRRRHHCRCCGEIFCDVHSTPRQFVLAPSTRPGEIQRARSADRVRVCDRCCPIPP